MKAFTRNGILKNVESEIKYRGERLLWGEPPKIVIAIMDRGCPICGRKTWEDPGLDLGIEDGVIYGGLCWNCGWSFGNG